MNAASVLLFTCDVFVALISVIGRWQHGKNCLCEVKSRRSTVRWKMLILVIRNKTLNMFRVYPRKNRLSKFCSPYFKEKTQKRSRSGRPTHATFKQQLHRYLNISVTAATGSIGLILIELLDKWNTFFKKLNSQKNENLEQETNQMYRKQFLGSSVCSKLYLKSECRFIDYVYRRKKPFIFTVTEKDKITFLIIYVIFNTNV